MLGEQIFERIADLKVKFRDFFQQRKQMTALQNHSMVKKFTDSEQEVFGVIKYCMKGSFLEDEDAEWITKKLDRMQINYLDWAHKTKWLKQTIQSEQPKKAPEIYQTFFDFAQASQNLYVPPNAIKPKPGARV
jgi:hypothetical protein